VRNRSNNSTEPFDTLPSTTAPTHFAPVGYFSQQLVALVFHSKSHLANVDWAVFHRTVPLLANTQPTATMSEASTGAGEHKQEIVRLEICPYGDMQIVLKTAEVYATYLVSSHQLCSASPVFRAMLGPNSSFAEAVELRRHQASTSSTNATKDLFEIVVEEHNPAALGAMLYIIHGRPQFLPDEISFENLMQVAIVVDYYDCAEVMRPWDEKWMKQWREHVENPGYENWLFIAWVFRVQEVFGTLTKIFSRKCIRINGEFMVNTAGPDDKVKNWKSLDCHIPQSVIGKIRRCYIWRILKLEADGMWGQRCTAAKEVVLCYRAASIVYDSTTRFPLFNIGGCLGTIQSRSCFNLRFAALQKGFKTIGIPMEFGDVDADSLLDDIAGRIKEVVDGLVTDFKIIRISTASHECCTYRERNMLVDIQNNIQQNVNSLQLKDFSREPLALKKEWEELLGGGVLVRDVTNLGEVEVKVDPELEL